MSAALLPCVCCGSAVIAKRDAYEVCPVCGWEDDPAQAIDPEFAGGANRFSLNAARSAWLAGLRDESS
jgi:hypothetical protein